MTSPPPVRTCIGCRKRTPATELLRVVVAPGAVGEGCTIGKPGDPSAGPTGVLTVVPDPRRRAGGRGAWVHPDRGCVETAVRRRAFARALRVPGTIDPGPVLQHVRSGQVGYEERSTTTSGTPQEMTSNGQSMKRHR